MVDLLVGPKYHWQNEQDELCSCPAQVLGFGRWCCALNAMGTMLSAQAIHVQDFSEADAENS